MDMDRRLRPGEAHDLGELVGCHREQAVRRHAEDEPLRRRARRKRIDEMREAVERVHEAPLGRAGRAAAEASVRVEHRQQCERDAGRARGIRDALRELGRIGVGIARRIVVHVVELRHRAVACLDHLHVHLRGDRLDGIGIETIEKGIHGPTPRPERIVAIGRWLPRATAQGALEGMRVDIGHGRNERSRNMLAGAIDDAGRDTRYRATAIDVHRDIARPSRGQQCRRREQPHGALAATRTTSTRAIAMDRRHAKSSRLAPAGPVAISRVLPSPLKAAPDTSRARRDRR